jgi:hypothetical protein
MGPDAARHRRRHHVRHHEGQEIGCAETSRNRRAAGKVIEVQALIGIHPTQQPACPASASGRSTAIVEYGDLETLLFRA